MNAITAAPHSVARPLMLRFLLQVIVQITREPWVHAMHANEDEPQQEIRTNRINDEMEFNPVHPACSFRRTQHPMRRILPAQHCGSQYSSGNLEKQAISESVRTYAVWAARAALSCAK